jgi:hypothetical protein
VVPAFTDMPHALMDLCLVRLTNEAAWLHKSFTDSETRAMGEGLVEIVRGHLHPNSPVALVVFDPSGKVLLKVAHEGELRQRGSYRQEITNHLSD